MRPLLDDQIIRAPLVGASRPAAPRPATVLRAALVLAAGTLVLAAPPAGAEIRSMEDCAARIAEDPELAREEAAHWVTFGGGASALICSAETLEALEADGAAARLYTETAQDMGNRLGPEVRAELFRRAGRLWLDENQPRLARETLNRALRLGEEDARLLALRAEALGRLNDWQGALADLDAAHALDAENAQVLGLRAAARRRLDDPEGGLADAEAALALDPTLAEGLFEKGAAQAMLGDMRAALDTWFVLIEQQPDSELARLAQRNMQRLSGN